MANVFDQFDAPQAPTVPPGGNVFDQFDGPQFQRAGLEQELGVAPGEAPVLGEAAAGASAELELPPRLEQSFGMIVGARDLSKRKFKLFLGRLRAANAEPGGIGGGSAEQPLLFDIARRFRAGKIDETQVRSELAAIEETKEGVARFAAESAGMLAGGPIAAGAARLIGAGSRLAGAARIVGTGVGGGAGTLATGGDLEEAATTAVLGAGVEAASLGVGKVIRGGLARRSAKTGAGQAIKAAERGGATIQPGLATDSAALDFAQNIVDGAIGSAGRAAKVKGKAVAGTVKELEKTVEKIGGRFGREELGTVISDAVDGGIELFKRRARARYLLLDRSIRRGVKAQGGAGRKSSAALVVDMKGVKAVAQKIQSGIGLKKTSGGTRSIIKDVLGASDSMTFAQAQAIRSDLLALTRTATDPLGSKAVGSAKLLARAVDRAMTKGAGRLSGDALAKWRAANAFWKEEGKLFNNKFIKALASKEPDELVVSLMSKKTPGAWRRVREIVTNGGKSPEAWRAVQGSFLGNIVKRSFKETKTGAKQLSASSVSRSLDQFGDDTLKEIFPDKAALQSFRLALRNVRIASSETEASIGKVAIQLGQAGAVTGLLIGNFTGAAVALTGGPVILGRLFTNPKFVRWLVTLRVAPDTFAKKRAIVAITKMAVSAGMTVKRKSAEKRQ